jgi:hypothetical protein
MNVDGNKWLTLRLIILGAALIFGGGKMQEPSDNPPPFWVFAIPFVFFTAFLPFYLRAFQATRDNIDNSVWEASPFRPFSDPLPFYHLCAWTGLVGGVRMLVECLLRRADYDMSAVWFLLSGGAGCFLGVLITQRSLRKAIKDGEQVAEPERETPPTG